MEKGKATRKGILLLGLMLFFGLAVCLGVQAEEAEKVVLPPVGEWAYEYEPTVLVLKVEENGKAWYGGKNYTWEDQAGFLKLTDNDGEELRLRYAEINGKKIIYPQTRFHRGKEVEGQGGLIGIWEGEDTGSSFVFTPAGYFLEDSVFSGNFMYNAEQGTFLLHYGDVFADVQCFYTLEEDILTVEYPWVIVERQPE